MNKISSFYLAVNHRKRNPSENNKLHHWNWTALFFSQLYVSCKVRNGDLVKLLKHEHQACPQFLSHFGDLRHGSKSDPLLQLEKSNYWIKRPKVNALVLDGTVLIKMLKPRKSKTFEDYFRDIIKPYFQIQCCILSGELISSGLNI